MAIIFKDPVKHGTLSVIPGIALAFEDDRAEEYFVAAGWADVTDKAPKHTYPAGTVVIDPDTVFAVTGQKVLSNG